MKVVINRGYGGFRLSAYALDTLEALGMEVGPDGVWAGDVRHDPRLVEVVERMGSYGASTDYSNLVVVEVSGSRYRIVEYDGAERVETPDTIVWVDAS